MTVKTSPESKMIRTWPSQSRILTRYVWNTLPRVKKELQRWRQLAAECPDPVLSAQALSSLINKDFHCYGGAVFAVGANDQEENLIELITAYQTICDYLDNLCDRADCLDGQAFRRLHVALLDALQPNREKAEYYEFYQHRDDGGYLAGLVTVCRDCLQKLPGYQHVQADILQLVEYYIDLQVKKHIDWTVREHQLITWAQAQAACYDDLLWQEFAAASGSTLAIFALLALAVCAEVNDDQVQEVKDTYFPWICGLHILLDYFIDREEDWQGGDLNFTFYYADQALMVRRFEDFISQSLARLHHLENPAFTRTVVEGLLAMYLSDQKVKRLGLQKTAASLLNQCGANSWHVYRLCALVRRFF
jgi:tetraprenyl-beta-curcumene synthase